MPTRGSPWLPVILAFSACTPVPEAPASGRAEPPSPTDQAEPPVATRVVGATLLRVAEVAGPLDARIAFGPGSTWWRWDGERATAYADGRAQEGTLDAEALLAAGPRAPVDRPLVVGSTLVMASGSRRLHATVVGAIGQAPPPWGYAVTGVAWSTDGTQVLVTEQWRSGRCCREATGPSPQQQVAHLYDAATGTHVELPGVELPSLLGRDRLLLAGRRDALYHRDPLYPLDAPLAIGWSTRALALGMDEQLVGQVVRMPDNGLELRLHRASDGAQLHAWPAPPDASALSFHPVHPLLMVAGAERLEVWRLDLERPARLAHAALTEAPEAILVHPDGHRVIVVGKAATVFDLALGEGPIGGDASTPLDLALVRDDPTIPALRTGTDAIAVTVDDALVHAYGRGRGLYAFDRADGGRRVRSWRRHGDATDGVAFAAGAPVVALAEPIVATTGTSEAPRHRIDVVDARTYEVTGTTWTPPGQLAHLVLSSRGTALAWALRDDPRVTLADAGGHALLRGSSGGSSVEAIAIADDDHRLAVANRHAEHNVRVYAVGEGEPTVLTVPRGVSSLLWSHDGARLFAMGFDGLIHVVALERGRIEATIDPKAGGAGPMARTPDGRRLVVARLSVVELDAATGTEISRHPTTTWLRSIAVAPDGRSVVVGDAEGTVRSIALE